MKKHIYIAAMLCSCMVVADAQELTGSLTVEGTYKPVIRNHDRLSGQPSRLQTPLPEVDLPVSLTPVTTPVKADFALQLVSDPSLNLPESRRGYLSITSGSWLNSNLSAGYRFVNTPKTTFGAWLQHNSSSLWRPSAPENLSPDEKMPRRYFYDQAIGFYLSHDFGSYGLLDADVSYRLSLFNYCTDLVRPISGTDYTAPYDAPSQTLNDVRVSALWSNNARLGFIAQAGMAYRYFGYRDFAHTALFPSSSVPMRENDLMPRLALGYRFSPASALMLNADAHILLYSRDEVLYDLPPTGLEQVNYPLPYGCTDDYGVVGLTPSYSYNAGNWSLRAGARVDLSWGTGSRFSAVHVAPDVAAQFAAGHFTASLSATGGVTPNTLASGSELDYYQAPSLIDNLPQYTPLNAMLELRLADMKGFSAGIHAGYAISDNTPVLGWYAYNLFNVNPMTPPSTVASFTPAATLSIKGFSLGADLGFRFGSLLNVQGAVSYQPQSYKTGWYNGADRPRWTIDASADISPAKGWNIGLGYEYRGVRTLWLGEWAAGTRTGHNFDSAVHRASLRLPDFCGLNASLSYSWAERFCLKAEVKNILGCDGNLCPILPTDGMNILGTFSVLF